MQDQKKKKNVVEPSSHLNAVSRSQEAFIDLKTARAKVMGHCLRKSGKCGLSHLLGSAKYLYHCRKTRQSFI